MKLLTPRIVACIAFLLFIADVYAQQAEKALDVFIKEHPQEKLYIHYDREYYRAGETIWFKAYLYHNGKPSDLSHHLYLQLSDPKGITITNQRYPVKGATVSGTINIPDSLAEGVYYLRATTPAMLNNDPAFLYKQPLLVVNPSARKSLPPAKTPDDITLRFFPESGNLIEGIQSVVAFRAADASGRPLEIYGSIKTNDTLVVTPFHTFHEGIGSFQMRPLAGKKYVAEILYKGKKIIFPLPEVMSSGINIRVEDENGGKAFTLTRSKKDKDQFAAVRLLVQSNNRIVYDEDISFDKFYLVKGHLLTDSIQSGILHFTVFNDKGLPLAERLSFVDNQEYEAGGKIDIIKYDTGRRAENDFAISFPDDIQRSLSVSVASIGYANFSNRNDIASAFLLTGDLRGEIDNPSWYFHKGKDTAVQKALDNLMITHGWSRFQWKKLLTEGMPPPTYQDECLFKITGTVYDESGSVLMNNGTLDAVFLLEDSSMLSYTVPVNQSGTFILDSLLFQGTARVYYTYKDVKAKEKKVKIAARQVFPALNNEIFPVTDPKQDSLSAGTAWRAFAATDEMPVIQINTPAPITLENVKLASKAKRPSDVVNAKYASAIFRSEGRIIADNITYPPNDRAMNALDFVINRVTTVSIQQGTFVNKKNFSLENHKDKANSKDGEMRYWEVALFLDEMPTTLVHLKSLRADQVALVKFYEAGFMGAGGAYPGGAIAVYLNEKPELKIPDKKTSTYTEAAYSGYTLVKEFYSPDYATAVNTTPFTDIRTTLYWNPELYTGSGTAIVQLKFYNNDLNKRFKIIVEGFDSNGRLVHLEKIPGE
ncbi:MAG: hypothetical protein NTW29_10030 [Bacteroidetes bacterium]|nr:hypothetical protein [Bacteroidota bacterium]